jgi:gliding motility-associated-like protein
VCEKGEFTFIDSSTTYWSPINSWVWHFDGLTSTLQSPTHTYVGAGTYPVTLKITNAWGCTDSALGSVVVNPPPPIYTSPDTVVCVSDSATLKAYGGVSYSWAPATDVSCSTCNPTHAGPSTETVYTVTGTDQYGCVNTDTVRVALKTHTTATAWGDTAVCRGKPVPLYVNGATKYSWSPNWLSNQHIANPFASPPSTQTYTVVSQLASCIPDTDYVHLEIFQLPEVDAGPDQRVLAGTICQIEAKGKLIHTLMWTPAEQLECDSCYASATTPMERSTTFFVDVTSPNGCKAIDSVRITIFCDNSQIFIPNSFTPNKDGENDKFYPRGKGVKYVKTFRIYNRWGELMYGRDNIQLNDDSKGWDGTFNGNAPRPDVYVYFMEAQCYTDEPIFIKGDVTILK